MKLKYYIAACLLALAISSCQNKKEEPKDLSKSTTTEMDTTQITDVTPANKPPTPKAKIIKKILPYKNPKSLEELLTTKYKVDTLYRKIIPNGIGNDDDTDELIFNKITGIAPKNVESRKCISAMERTSYFDPIYQKDQKYYLPFFLDEDFSVMLVWEQTAEGLIFSKNYYHLFINKYGKMKVSDILVMNNQKIFLVELYQPDESGSHSTRINILKDQGSNSLILLEELEIESESKGDFKECCFLELIDDNRIKVRRKTATSNFEKIIQLN